MYQELVKMLPITNYYLLEEDTVIDDLIIHVFKTSHDVEDSNGYIFESDNKSIVYITDTGYINVKYHKMLVNKDFYVMESNHDVRMLMDGKYPYHLKQRIVGDRGHLSNKDSANYLANFIGDKTKGIVLIHLSEDNNNPDIAYNTLKQTLERTPPELSSDIMEKGIVLAGGGALIKNLDKLVAERTEMPVYIAETPLDCVVKGTGKTLEDLEKLKTILINARRRK